MFANPYPMRGVLTSKVFLGVCCFVFLVACNAIRVREGWDESYGPVVPHDTFPTDCSLCHISGDWHTLKEGFAFDHEAETGVALLGAHAEVQCLLCHNDRGPAGVFAGRGCAGCHVDIHKGTQGALCESCHTEESWRLRDAIALHDRTRFPLVGPHAAAACFECHEGAELGNFAGLDPDCLICHADDLARVDEPDHMAQGWVSDCQRCHIPLGWKPAVFGHPASFPLSAGHGGLDCLECHEADTFSGLSGDCVSCHLGEFQNTTNPNHLSAGFSTDCEQCHTTSTWGNANFVHVPTFPLTNSHGGLDCVDCHTGVGGGGGGFAARGVGGVFAGLSTDCASCHLDSYQSADDPDHVAGGFPTDCTQCHDTVGWQGAEFNHPAAFQLTNSHGGLDCFDCHVGGVFTGISGDCVTCHLGDFQATTDPDHVGAGFPTDCTQCHDTAMWEGAIFGHTASFALTNSHGGLDCVDCHVGGVFTGLSTDCAFCHLDDYQGTTDPDHQGAGFPLECMQCHDTVMWEGAIFGHPATFPLTNSHTGLDCTDCHVGGVFTGLSTDCAFCHLDDFQATDDPDHQSAGFPLDCIQCHDTSMWDGAVFNHSPTFPLTNAHAAPTCTDCHIGGVFGGLPADCAFCHLDDFNATNDPNHQSAGFPLDCIQCHDTSMWDGAVFNHSPTFPLTNAHAAPTCTDCHEGGVFGGLPTDCASCHMDDYQGSTNPNHASAGFPTDCTVCHNTMMWEGAMFTHTPAFPLTNSHATPSCLDCHTGGLFFGLPSDCASCHLGDFLATTDPQHVGAGFPTDCEQCHGTTGWQGAVFTHTPAFPLVQGHSGRSCNDCHGSGVFGGLASDCVACHFGDYQATNDPDHAAVGFPTDCMQCHDISAWENGVFNHSFPLQGDHGNLSCTDCHIMPAPAFSCIDCHEHRQSKMDDKHSDVGGYVWASSFCLDCHPDGRD